MVRPVVLLTDFGTQDWFVGVMKGIVLQYCPGAQLIDLCHEIAPQDVRQAEFVLRVTREWFPRGTVFLCVVDPGVGTAREAAVFHDEIKDHYFVGPNNALFSFLADHADVSGWRIAERAEHSVSATFHGRDIFAPVAGQLASGQKVCELVKDEIALITLPVTTTSEGEGEILYFDRFGNALTTIERGSAATHVHLISQSITLPLVWTYADVAERQPLAYWGSSGHLEMAVRNGNAREVLQLNLHDRVRLTNVPT